MVRKRLQCYGSNIDESRSCNGICKSHFLRQRGTSRSMIQRIATASRDQHLQSPATTGDAMQATTKLHDLGQSIWLDNITRELLDTRTLDRYIDEFSVTGLTSNPTIFDHAIGHSTSYDADIAFEAAAGKSGNDVFFEL